MSIEKLRAQKVSEQMPAPHKKYLVYRIGVGPFVATPCYGMHQPWWVPYLVESEGRNWCKSIDMDQTDEWVSWPSDELARRTMLGVFVQRFIDAHEDSKP